MSLLNLHPSNPFTINKDFSLHQASEPNSSAPFRKSIAIHPANKRLRSFSSAGFLLLLGTIKLFSATSVEASEEHSNLNQYSKKVAEAAQELIEITPTGQRNQLTEPFHNPKRTSGRETKATPSFCGVLAWCKPQGLPQGAMNYDQLSSLHRLLRAALSSGGYQSLLSVINRQRIIGEMENISEKNSVATAARLYPESRAESIQSFSSLAESNRRNWYPSIGGMTTPPNSKLKWTWQPPGFTARREQFEDYSLLISGNPGKDKLWGLRFEGHHITINLTFEKNPNGAIKVYGSPLFLGAFPMIVPASPDKESFKNTQWEWTQGQTLLLGVTEALKGFTSSLPEKYQTNSKISPDHLQQAAPLLADTPPPFLLSALSTKPDQKLIKRYPYIDLNPKDLSETATWHLQQAFEAYFSPMHFDVANRYRRRLTNALATNQRIRFSWAGGEPTKIGSHHYSYLEIDGLLLELLQSNQFSAQHESAPNGNHVHGMLRDLKFNWERPNPMVKHHQKHSHGNIYHSHN